MDKEKFRYYHPIPLNSDGVPAHNKAVRDRMVGMSISEIEIEFGDCPVWRRAMG